MQYFILLGAVIGKGYMLQHNIIAGYGYDFPESGSTGRFKSSFAASTAYSIDFASLMKVVAFINGPTMLRERIIPIASSAGEILPFCTSKRPTGRTPRSVVA